MLNISKFITILATLILLVILAVLGGFEFYSSVFDQGDSEIEIIFGGDVMFDRYIRQVAEVRGYNFILSDLRSYLNSADFVLANLEGPITREESISLGSKIGGENNYTFTFSPKTIEALKVSNINILNLGNNHIYNFGSDGVDDTEYHLTQAGIKYFGLSSMKGIRINKKGVSVFMLNYNQFDTVPTSETLSMIRREENRNDYIVVYTHWGEEYEKIQPDYIKKRAREFVDAGADLVFGSHPHVIGEKEEHKKGVIYYSLGNFVFDQYWNDDVSTGLLVKVSLGKEGFKILEERRVKLTPNGQTKLFRDGKDLFD